MTQSHNPAVATDPRPKAPCMLFSGAQPNYCRFGAKTTGGERMHNKSTAAAAVFILCAAFPSSAQAEDCRPQGIAASVQLLRSADGYVPVLPVEMNGQPKTMLLDTSGTLTEILPRTADSLGLPRQKGEFTVIDASRRYSSDYVNVPLKIGRISSKGVGMIILPNDGDLGGGASADGVLAPDILSNYDIDIDFGTGRLNFISQDHCFGRVIYWPATAVAAVPMQRIIHSWIAISVKLDGQPTLAIVDTSTARSSMYSAIAERVFGLKLGGPDTPSIGNMSDHPESVIYRHAFKMLEFDGITVTNPDVQIVPDLLKNTKSRHSEAETGSLLTNSVLDEDSIQMRIGMDVLRQLHVYAAYKERILYLTAAGQPSNGTAGNGSSP